MTPRRIVTAWNDIAAKPDDAPLWAEVLGMVFAPALFARAGVHVWVALLADVDPRLADGSDVSLRSPIRGLRGDRHDVLARIGTAGAGIVAFGAWPPSMLFSAEPAPLAVWMLAQTYALGADPLAYLLNHVR